MIKTTDSENWRNKGDGVWEHKTTYFCNSRGKERVKWIKYLEVKCSICDEIHLQKKSDVNKYKRSYCSDECRAKSIKTYYRNHNHMSYKDGRYKDGSGYICVLKPEHHRADSHGYVKEHILVAEKVIGRKIKNDEEVHHINEIKDDNRPENLRVLSISEHN